MKKCVLILMGLLAAWVGCSANSVKLGEAQIAVEILGAGAIDSLLHDMEVWVHTTPIFADDIESVEVTSLNRSGSRFYGEIPVEREREIVTVTLNRGGNHIGGTALELRQDAPVELTITVNPNDGTISDIEYVNSELGLAEWMNVGAPTQLLLDLLAGYSYVRQIEAKEPLTDVQIQNINEGFTDDIGRLVLAINERTLAEAVKEVKMANLVDNVDFDLQNYIDENFPGQPVVVDMWNIWCSPCLSAIHTMRPIKREMADKDLVFLYLSDDSSKEDAWESKVQEIGGQQLRVSKDASNAILEQNSLGGFPSYLFFDREYKMVKAYTGYRGNKIFRADLEAIFNIKL